MRELFAVIANEWMKLFHRRRFLIVSVLCLCVIGIYAFTAYLSQQNQVRYNNPILNLNMEIQSISQQIDQMNQSNDPQKQESIAGLQQKLAQDKADLAYITELQSANWKKAVQNKILANQQIISSIQASTSQASTSLSKQQQISNQQQITSLQATNGQLQYSLTHNLKPLPIGALTPYTETRVFMDIVSLTFLPLIIVVLVGDMLSGESTAGTIKLLLVRPVSRTKIIVGKWIVCLLSTALLCGLLRLAIFLCSILIFSSKGGLQPTYAGIRYTFMRVLDTSNNSGGISQMVPIAHYEHAILLPEWQMFVYGIFFTMFSMMAVASIAFFLSTLLKSAMASTATAIGVVIVSFIVTKIMTPMAFTRYIFTTHLDLTMNWIGETAMMMQQPITLGMGIIVLLIWGITSLLLSIIIFSRRDILNA